MIPQPRTLSQVVTAMAYQWHLYIGVETAVRGAEPGSICTVLFFVPHIPFREQEVNVFTVHHGLYKVVVVLRVTSHNQFTKLFLLRECPARCDHWVETSSCNGRDVPRSFTRVTPPNQHETQQATRFLFILYNDDHSNCGDTWVVGSDILSVNRV